MDDYHLLAENFGVVEEGETFAETADTEFVADHRFSPVLMSENGYDEIFGYKGQKAGDSLAAAREQWSTWASIG